MDEAADETPSVDVERLRRALQKHATELGVLHGALIKVSAPPMLTTPIADAIAKLLEAQQEALSVYDN